MSSTNKNVPYGIYPVDTTTRYYDRVPVTVVSGVTVQANTPYKYHTDKIKITPAGKTDAPSGVIVQVYRPNGDTNGFTYGEPADSAVLAADNDGTCLAMVAEKDSPNVTFQSVINHDFPSIPVGDGLAYDSSLGGLTYSPVSGPFSFVRYANKTAFSGSENSKGAGIVVKIATPSYSGGTAVTASQSPTSATLSGKLTKYDFGNTTTNADLTIPASNGTGAAAIDPATAIVVRKTHATGTVTVIVGTSKKAFDVDGETEIGATITNGKYAVLVPYTNGDWIAIESNIV